MNCQICNLLVKIFEIFVFVLGQTYRGKFKVVNDSLIKKSDEKC